MIAERPALKRYEGGVDLAATNLGESRPEQREREKRPVVAATLEQIEFYRDPPLTFVREAGEGRGGEPLATRGRHTSA
jgi:hypothetical protein